MKLRILMIHNYYQHWGGEDRSTEQEIQLLTDYGNEVEFFYRHNDEIKSFPKFRMVGLFFEATWSPTSYRNITKVIQKFKPDIIHCQNFFPLISPALFYAAARSKVPVIQTLRNYRLLCPVGLFARNGKVCEECMQHSLLRSIQYGCYRGSSPQTASVALMLKTHRILKTWSKRVNKFITLTEFSRQKFIQGGLPADKIVVRPNFLVNDPGVENTERKYALFVGRLSREKGVETLLEAWRQIPNLPLKIIGDGDLFEWTKQYIIKHNISHIELLGFKSPSEVTEYQRKAKFIIMPSIWYETFGRVILEGYAVGTPAIVSNLGAMADIVENGVTGLHFDAGNANDLAQKVQYALANQDKLKTFGENARYKYEKQFSAESAYYRLMDIYQQTLDKDSS